MSDLEDDSFGQPEELPARVQAFVQRLYRDPRYLLVGKSERFGRQQMSFVEACTVLSATGEVRGQLLLNSEYELDGRPDGERPYGHRSLVEFYLSQSTEERTPSSEEDLALLREESWVHYVRRNFAFLLGDFALAREDADHNLAIWNLVEQAQASDRAKWSYMRWWPWIERDRAIAEALWNLQHGRADQAATELYRAQRSIEQYGVRHADQYAREEGEGKTLCEQMRQHVTALVDLLREEEAIPVSLEEQLDQATARGDTEEVERLRSEMIRRAVDDGE